VFRFSGECKTETPETLLKRYFWEILSIQRSACRAGNNKHRSFDTGLKQRILESRVVFDLNERFTTPSRPEQ
jgi:hypothetical protein